MKKHVVCIVAAGGSGTRMGKNVNKLFLEVNGIPVIIHTLLAFENAQIIDEIIVSAKEEDMIFLAELISVYKISKVKTIIKGGATRGESILSAYKELPNETDIVVVHDGARPMITEEMIDETVKSAVSFGAAACGVKPKCTLKSVDEGFISTTVDREKTVEIQTPQAFSKELFDEMYSLDSDTIKSATDDCVLAEKTGAKIFVTEGSYKNIKITTPEDIQIAEMLLERG